MKIPSPSNLRRDGPAIIYADRLRCLREASAFKAGTERADYSRGGLGRKDNAHTPTWLSQSRETWRKTGFRQALQQALRQAQGRLRAGSTSIFRLSRFRYGRFAAHSTSERPFCQRTLRTLCIHGYFLTANGPIIGSGRRRLQKADSGWIW